MPLEKVEFGEGLPGFAVGATDQPAIIVIQASAHQWWAGPAAASDAGCRPAWTCDTKTKHAHGPKEARTPTSQRPGTTHLA